MCGIVVATATRTSNLLQLVIPANKNEFKNKFNKHARLARFNAVKIVLNMWMERRIWKKTCVSYRIARDLRSCARARVRQFFCKNNHPMENAPLPPHKKLRSKHKCTQPHRHHHYQHTYKLMQKICKAFIKCLLKTI